ncbi:PucR family transcriptional regulator [Cohnella sp. JJ-181]|uniref:PucR family transcriptional regulator n=1 Tax=Cohnella rhizoplanae TaxID=2974897 RepID=UPI0022FF9D3E|nr:helix-turn-helix domain-containing protein [Cohnella sp. JJ-181]CAI6034277.1 Proline-responsive transcriptional activator PutR [Cohnella sp. JJ-181]
MRNDKEPFERSFDSLEQLADTISEELQCSVTIEDANHKLIAYSSHHAETDPARISTIIGKRVPDKVIQALWREGAIPRLMKSEGPLRIASIGEIGLGDRIAIAIRKENQILGYIWIVTGEDPLPQAFLFGQLVQAAQAAKTKLLQLHMTHRRAEQSQQEFFRQLLSGDVGSDADVRRRADELGLSLPAYFCVNVLPFPAEIADKQQQQIQYLITTTLQGQIALHAIDRDRLILLEALPARLTKGPSIPALTRLTEQMTQRFESAPLAGGIGSVYDDYSRVSASCEEAVAVIRLRQRFPVELKKVQYYTDLGFYRLLPAVEHHRLAHPYVNESLRLLENYDLEHNGELLRTLEVYLCQDSNLKASAEALHIHENTLSYRLKRISHIGGIDLDRMDDKVTCYLELKARRLR